MQADLDPEPELDGDTPLISQMKAAKMRQGLLFIQEDRTTQGSTIKGRTVNRKQEVNYREHKDTAGHAMPI